MTKAKKQDLFFLPIYVFFVFKLLFVFGIYELDASWGEKVNSELRWVVNLFGYNEMSTVTSNFSNNLEEESVHSLECYLESQNYSF